MKLVLLILLSIQTCTWEEWRSHSLQHGDKSRDFLDKITAESILGESARDVEEETGYGTTAWGSAWRCFARNVDSATGKIGKIEAVYSSYAEGWYAEEQYYNLQVKHAGDSLSTLPLGDESFSYSDGTSYILVARRNSDILKVTVALTSHTSLQALHSAVKNMVGERH